VGKNIHVAMFLSFFSVLRIRGSWPFYVTNPRFDIKMQ